MKKLLIIAAIALSCISSVQALTYVRGYYRSTGTYVSPYIRTSPDAYKFNNFSYKAPSYSYKVPSYNYSYKYSYGKYAR